MPPTIVSSNPATVALRRHHPLGLSTGCFEDERGDWRALIAGAVDFSSFAAELAALEPDEFLALVDHLTGAPSPPLGYLSVHAPSKSLAGPFELADLIDRVPSYADAIVVHPDTLGEPALFTRHGRRLAIENMDPRKHDGRTTDELQPYFDALPQAGFCFDIAHAGAVDAGMGEANEMLDRFGAQLRHLHISSLDEDHHHVPLTPADAERFAPVLARCRDVPWILEAPLPPD